jgi:transcriptional regulator with XRE-family HTH domain
MSGGTNPLGGPDPVDLHISARLRQLRTSRGFTQKALADVVGITPQQVQKYEHARNRVSASMLYGLARALGVPLWAFFEGLPQTVRQTTKAP